MKDKKKAETLTEACEALANNVDNLKKEFVKVINESLDGSLDYIKKMSKPTVKFTKDQLDRIKDSFTKK